MYYTGPVELNVDGIRCLDEDDAVCWVVVPCRLVQIYRRFGGVCCLMMEAARNSETSVNYHATRRNIPAESRWKSEISPAEIKFAEQTAFSEHTVLCKQCFLQACWQRRGNFCCDSCVWFSHDMKTFLLRV
jgi:hypothetical protein